jgi:hypothetical protein
MTAAERHLIWFLRASAVMLMAAAPAVVMPSACMRTIGAWLGLEVPDSPLVEYLTRSVSAVYAALGAYCWILSGDVRRYLPLLRFMVPLTALFDVTLIALDVMIPMPIAWTVGEAAAIVGWTIALWWLVRSVGQSGP